MQLSNSVKFRLLLPIFFFTLSIVLAERGEAYRDRIVQSVVAKYGHLYEPLPDNVAFARFVDYALNAPAWAAAWKMPFVLPHDWNVACCGIMRYEAHWWYFLFVIVMWYLIGLGLDKRAVARHPGAPPDRSRARYVLQACSFAYGAFVTYMGISQTEAHGYARWFEVGVCTWGIGLMLVSGYFMARRRQTAQATDASVSSRT